VTLEWCCVMGATCSLGCLHRQADDEGRALADFGFNHPIVLLVALDECRRPWTGPSPVPRSPLVVKNGSRQRRRTSSVMPVPVSPTSSTTWSVVAVRVRMVIVPPRGMASTALKMQVGQRCAQVRRRCRRSSGTSCNSVRTFTATLSSFGFGLPLGLLSARRPRSTRSLIFTGAIWASLFLTVAIKLAEAVDDLAGVLRGGVHHLDVANCGFFLVVEYVRADGAAVRCRRGWRSASC
jgi:hypothetical protein